MKTTKLYFQILAILGICGLFFLTNYSCKDGVTGKDELEKNDFLVKKAYPLKDYSPEIKFAVTGRMLEGKFISGIETDYNGNIWIASTKELYYYKNGVLLESYTLDFPILEISISGDESLWIGTNGGGLAHLSNKQFTWFNKANSGLTRDYINNVLVGLDGRIWFSSCQSNAGGLMVYDGKEFKLFNPENSRLNQYVIDDIGIDQYGNIYVSTMGYVTKANVYRMKDNNWECLGNDNGTFYWTYSFSVGPSGVIFLLEDFSLSSGSNHNNKIYTYFQNQWKPIECDYYPYNGFPIYIAKVDMRNYCWFASKVISKTGHFLHVYDGKSWTDSPEGILPEDQITTIKVDFDNNIWIGTAHNGIFILKQ